MRPSEGVSWASFLHVLKSAGQKGGEVFSVALFAVLYIVAFAPVAVVAKLSGKKFLPHWSADTPTFFFKKEKIDPSIDYLRRQW